MSTTNEWFVQRYGAKFYLCRAAANPLPGEPSYEDYTDKDGDRAYFGTREAAESAASSIT